MKYVITIDFGGTKIKTAIVNSKGKVLKFSEIDTKAEKGKEKVILRLENSISDLLRIAKKQNYQISKIGIGAPGPLNPQKGEIINPPNLPGWKNVPLKKILEEKFNLPVLIQNDANCALLGEKWKGRAKNVKNAIMFTLGTGVGGAILIDGKLYTGHSGMAGELGHITIVKDGLKCGCGNKGCFESYASVKALEKRAKNLGLKFKDARDVFVKAEKGNKIAQRAVSEMLEYLTIGIANLINIFDPELIILGGGLMISSDLFLTRLKKQVQKRAFIPSSKKIKIAPAALGNKFAGIIGVAFLVLEKFERK